jgi:hypothetical protein
MDSGKEVSINIDLSDDDEILEIEYSEPYRDPKTLLQNVVYH